MKKDTLIYLLVIIVLTFLLALTWGKKRKVNTVYIENPADTVYIQINKYSVDTVYKPQIDTIINTVVKTKLDTVFIVKDYLTKKIYTDTLKDDSVAFAQIIDVVSENEIKNRHFTLDIYNKT